MQSGELVKFRLYIAGGTSNSVQAQSNLTALCHKYLQNQHEIEVVDVLRDPALALRDGVFLTPMLVQLEPLPVKKIVGNLSQQSIVAQALSLLLPA